jgi:branched-chain amino acid transport system substrate-binding protein
MKIPNLKLLPVFFLLIISLSCTKTKPREEIVVGQFGSLTGKFSKYGISSRNGVELAMEEVNRSGGVLGKRIRMVFEDDASQPEKAQEAISRLISGHHVVGVIGEVVSSRTRAAAPVSQQNRIPLITPAATDPRITQIGNFIFRACFVESYQGYLLARFATSTLRMTRVAILRDISNDYSNGIADEFGSNFRKEGGVVVTDQKYKEGDSDFASQLITIRTVRPQAILVSGLYKDAAQIAIQARDLGLAVPLLGPDAWENPELVSIAGNALHHSYYSSHYSAMDRNEKNRKFVETYRLKYKTDPDAFAALSYDAFYLLIDAIQRARSVEPEKVRIALSGTLSFSGVTGPISIDQNRNAIKPGVIFKFEKGRYEFLKRIPPQP